MADFSALPPLEQKELRELLTRAQAGDQGASELLLRHNMLLVHKLARRFSGADNPEDLVQVGLIGLLKAIRDFDLARNLSFSTYAVPKVLGEIKMYLRNNNMLKISRSTLQVSAKVKKCRAQLEQELNRQPTVAEVAEILDISPEEVAAAEIAVEAPVELEYVSDTTTSVDDLRIALKEMLNRLEKRERQVIILRYFSELTQAEVAEKLGISQGHVSRIERNVLARLRASLE